MVRDPAIPEPKWRQRSATFTKTDEICLAESLTIHILFFAAKGPLETFGLVKNLLGTSGLTKESPCRTLTQSYITLTHGLYHAYTALAQSLRKSYAKLTQSLHTVQLC